MKIKVGRSDVIWNFIGTILSLGVNILILPFILFYLSNEDVAVYYVFTSLSGIAALFDFGFTPSIARSMAYAFSGVTSIEIEGTGTSKVEMPNYLLMKKIIIACKLIYTFLATLALLISLVFGTIYVNHITSTILEGNYIFPWILYSIAIFFNILFGFYSVFLRGVGAVAEINISMFISRLLQIFLSVFLLIFGAGLLGVSIAYLVYGIVFRMISKRKFYKYKNIGIELDNINNKINIREILVLLNNLWPNTWKDGLVTLSNYLVGQATTIIASLYLSLNQTGVYSLGVQLTTAVASVSSSFLTVYQPALQSAFAVRDVKSQRKYLSLIVFSFSIYFPLLMCILSTIGIQILKIIKPSFEINIPILLGIGLYQFIIYFRNCYCSYISTTNRIIYYKSYIISSILSIILSFAISEVFRIGVWGFIVAQLMSQLIFNAWYWPLLAHKELNLSVGKTINTGWNESIKLLKR